MLNEYKITIPFYSKSTKLIRLKQILNFYLFILFFYNI